MNAAKYLDQFQHRLLQDALAEASASYWRRRADDLLAARPDPANDFIPEGCIDEARIRWQELTDAAATCRQKADLIERYGRDGMQSDVRGVLSDIEATS